MALTAETLVAHELAGLHVRVVDATNPDLVGIQGRVRRETTNTLVIADSRDAVSRQVPKAEATFEFAFVPTDEAAGAPDEEPRQTRDVAREGPGISVELAGQSAGETVTYVTVDGQRLIARPARRTEHRGDSTWESD
jgi:ribonuclease P protein subunit POP4